MIGDAGDTDPRSVMTTSDASIILSMNHNTSEDPRFSDIVLW